MATLSITLCGREVQSFQELVDSLPADAVSSPKRSTVPLTDYWREPQRRLAQLWREVGRRRSGSTELHFEYAVPVRAGQGKASYTDLMILGDGVAVAIEAKFTEPPYESVGSWLGLSPTPNRRAVLDGWLGAVARVVGGVVTAESVMELPYQLIHRTASVCCMDRPERYVVYQLFGDAPSAYYAEQLGNLAAVLAANDRIRFIILQCCFQRTEAYRRLEAMWESGDREPGDQVRKALLAGHLFEFHDPVATPIRPAA